MKYEVTLGHIITILLSIFLTAGASWTTINNRISVLETEQKSLENQITKEIVYIREDMKEIKISLKDLQNTLKNK